MIDVTYVLGLGFYLYSLRAVQKTHLIVSDASSTHIISTNLTFPRSSSRSFLRATRHLAGTVGTRRRQGDMRATNLLRQLRHPVPSPPQETPPSQKHVRDRYARLKCFGDCYRTVLEPTPFPHLNYVLGDIKFVGKTHKYRIENPLAAAALAPRLLKHCKEVDINNSHVSLAHAYASVLKVTAKQHGIRLIGELVSCSACSREKEDRPPTPHHVTRRVTQLLELVHIDTAGPYPTFLGGSRYVVMFVDSASRRQRTVRRARKERGRYCFCCETLRGRYGSPTRVSH